MLPKSQRIPRELFKPLLSSRNFLNSTHFSLRLTPAPDLKVAVSVSKKVSKLAVIRNRIRRRTYSALREVLGEVKPHLLLFVAKTGTEKLKGEPLKQELSKLISSIRN